MSGGIYTITVNEKQYLGRTSNFERRKRDHLRMLRNNTHPNSHLQNVFDKYGEESFLFELIEEINDHLLLPALEQKYLDELDYARCYNISKDSTGGVYQNGKKTGNYGKFASLETRQKLSDSHKGIKQSAEQIQKRVAKLKGKKRSKEIVEKMKEIKAKKYRMISPAGIVFEVKNLKNFCQENNLNYNSMHDVSRNKRSSCYGWKVYLLTQEI